MARTDKIERQLIENYSRLLDFHDLASVLGITLRAARIQDQRGTLPVQMRRVPGRRGKIVPARVVAEYLAGLENA